MRNRWRRVAVRPLRAEGIVDRQRRAIRAPAGKLAAIDGQQEAQRRYQTRADLQQPVARPHRFARQPKIALREIAQPAMHQLRGAARRAPGEIAPLDQQRPQPQMRRLAQQPRAGDAAADDDNVPWPANALPGGLALPHHPPAPSRGLWYRL